MDVFFYILLGAGTLISIVLVIAGILGLVKKQTYALDVKKNTAHKVEGTEARRTSIIYLAAGLAWAGYMIFRLLTGP